MTITPQVAKTIKAIVAAHRFWVNAITADDDLVAQAALDDLKQFLNSFRTACPHCGTAMTTLYCRHLTEYPSVHTLRRCDTCRTLTLTYTPGT